jgi:hypothetical protein
MKVLLPVTSEQTISIIPRSKSLDGVDVVIIKDGEGVKETVSDITPIVNGNYMDLSFSSTILEEGCGYFLECSQNGNLYYRDKIYATSKTNFTVKHKQSQDEYTEYNVLDDNTYIIK